MTNPNPTRYLYPSPIPFSPLTEDQLHKRQTLEEGRAVVAAANPAGDRPMTDEFAAQATFHANAAMAYCEASLVRFGNYYVPDLEDVDCGRCGGPIATPGLCEACAEDRAVTR